MSNTFAAHIITADAVNLGTPEVFVTICDSEDGQEDLIATYPLSDADTLQSALDTLWENGWRTLDDPSQVYTCVDVGYDIVTVEPADPELVQKHQK